MEVQEATSVGSFWLTGSYVHLNDERRIAMRKRVVVIKLQSRH